MIQQQQISWRQGSDGDKSVNGRNIADDNNEMAGSGEARRGKSNSGFEDKNGSLRDRLQMFGILRFGNCTSLLCALYDF